MSENGEDFVRYSSEGRIHDLKIYALSSGEDRIEDMNSSRRESLCFPFPCFGTEKPSLLETLIYNSLMLDGKRKRRERYTFI